MQYCFVVLRGNLRIGEMRFGVGGDDVKTSVPLPTPGQQQLQRIRRSCRREADTKLCPQSSGVVCISWWRKPTHGTFHAERPGT